MNEIERIIARFSPIELRMFRAMGGCVSPRVAAKIEAKTSFDCDPATGEEGEDDGRYGPLSQSHYEAVLAGQHRARERRQEHQQAVRAA